MQVPAPKPIYLQGRQVRGLDNLAGSCFINAALQVIAHDDVLRKRVVNVHAAPEIHTFFARYDQAHADLTQAHADLVAYIRKAGHMPPGAGYTEVVLDQLGADYTPLWLKEMGVIVTHLGAGERHFNVSAVSNQLNRRFDGMPENARIQHFIYYTGGHYLSYFRNGERWIEANDASVKVVDKTTIAALPNKPVGSAAYSGIAFAAYQ
jgi:ubiquitin C-terminal hydrolase